MGAPKTIFLFPDKGISYYHTERPIVTGRYGATADRVNATQVEYISVEAHKKEVARLKRLLRQVAKSAEQIAEQRDE